MRRSVLALGASIMLIVGRLQQWRHARPEQRW